MSFIKVGDFALSPQVVSDYLTSHKRYEIIKVFSDDSFVILDDNEKKLYCQIKNDGHLNGSNWILEN